MAYRYLNEDNVDADADADDVAVVVVEDVRSGKDKSSEYNNKLFSNHLLRFAIKTGVLRDRFIPSSFKESSNCLE